MIRQQRSFSTRPGMGGSIIGFLVMALLLYMFFSVAAFTVRTLIDGLPFFLGLGLVFAGITYFLNKQILFSYFRRLKQDFNVRPIRAIVRSLWTVIGAPFVFGGLLIKALFFKKVQETFGDQARQAEAFMRQRQQQARGRGTLGDEGSNTGYREVRRDDGMIIRIPREEES